MQRSDGSSSPRTPRAPPKSKTKTKNSLGGIGLDGSRSGGGRSATGSGTLIAASSAVSALSLRLSRQQQSDNQRRDREASDSDTPRLSRPSQLELDVSTTSLEDNLGRLLKQTSTSNSQSTPNYKPSLESERDGPTDAFLSRTPAVSIPAGSSFHRHHIHSTSPPASSVDSSEVGFQMDRGASDPALSLLPISLDEHKTPSTQLVELDTRSSTDTANELHLSIPSSSYVGRSTVQTEPKPHLSIPSSSYVGRSTVQTEPKPLSFDASVFGRGMSLIKPIASSKRSSIISPELQKDQDQSVATPNLSLFSPSVPSTQYHTNDSEARNSTNSIDSESNDDDYDDDEGQMFTTHVSVKVPPPTANTTVQPTPQRSPASGTSPSRIITNRDIRKVTTTDAKVNASIGSPRTGLRRDSRGNSSSPFQRTPSYVGMSDVARKPSFPSLGRSSVTASPFSTVQANNQYPIPPRSTTPGVDVVTRPPIRNVSFGDVASLQRQYHYPSSQDSSGFIHRASSPFPGGSSSILGSSVGSFRRNLSGVAVKRKDSIVSASSVGAPGSLASSYVMQSPAMSYLSMLAEKMAEPSRGVYNDGDQVGDWVLGKEIGHGSFSRVFEATPAAESELGQALPTSTKVAVKIVAKSIPDSEADSALLASRQASFASLTSLIATPGAMSSPVSSSTTTTELGKADQDDVRRLLDHEIAIWASLEHPHLLGMIQMMDVDDAVFIVSELAEGGNLLDYVSKYGRLKEHVARSVIAQVVDALVYLHTIIRVVHRDVKLDNVLVMEKVEVVRTGEEWVPTVKLADFGLSERLERGSGEAGSPCGAGREDGYCVGSLHYCAPEEVRAVGSPSPAADVWSLGCVLYTVLCGALPFNDDYLPRLQMAIMKGEYDEGRLERCGVSEVGRKLVREMLEVDVEKRLTIQQVWSHPFFKDVDTL